MIEVYDPAYYATREREARLLADHAATPAQRCLQEELAQQYAALARDAAPRARQQRDW